MDIKQPGFTRFTRFGANIGRLHVTAAKHTEGLDGTDTLEITCAEDLSKNDYIVWQDRRGFWHEHIVDTSTRTHDDSGDTATVAVCINSIAETWDDYIEDKRPNGSVQRALASVLETSRWVAGTCTQEGTASHTFYHESVREALSELVEAWGGELETLITCDGNAVMRREVRIRSIRGNQESAKRFTWSKDLISISRAVASDNPKSRIYAYGKGEETEAGGYGRRIGIESVNNGKAYVEDEQATSLWGHPRDDGTIAPACGVYVNETCDDPQTLLSEAQAALETAKMPVVTYQAEVIDLVQFGRDWEDVALGDLVTIIDKGFSDDGIRLKGRISKLDRDLLTYDTTVTFGNLVDAIATPWQSIRSKLASLNKRSLNWDLAGAASQEWLDTLIRGLNAAYNQAGTYHYSSFEHGEIWSNVPLDENGNATRSDGWAMNINGMGFRLANTLNADGSWNWRTFGNGEGFTADDINTGKLKADLIEGGIITGGQNNKFLIDLDNGDIYSFDRYGVGAEISNGKITFKKWTLNLAPPYDIKPATTYGGIRSTPVDIADTCVWGSHGVEIGPDSKIGNGSWSSLMFSPNFAAGGPAVIAGDGGTIVAAENNSLAIYGGKKFQQDYLSAVPGVFISSSSSDLRLYGDNIVLNGTLMPTSNQEGVNYKTISFTDRSGDLHNITVRNGIVTNLS